MTSISNTDDLAHKICSLLKDWLKDKSQGLSISVRQLTEETVFVDMIQRLVDYGNADILNSFVIRLQMEAHANNDNFAKKEEPRD
ncbi:MAG TPA: hypothetical protein VJ729_08505 [Nitrososphaeraceae archaeon]|nr:hypothetical protein [Nitrososphaeraceae archaeon]